MLTYTMQLIYTYVGGICSKINFGDWKNDTIFSAGDFCLSFQHRKEQGNWQLYDDFKGTFSTDSISLVVYLNGPWL